MVMVRFVALAALRRGSVRSLRPGKARAYISWNYIIVSEEGGYRGEGDHPKSTIQNWIQRCPPYGEPLQISSEQT